jgi:hypothetical protein
MPYNIVSKKPLPKTRAISISESQKKELTAHFKKYPHTPEQKKLMRKILKDNPKYTIEQAHNAMLKRK